MVRKMLTVRRLGAAAWSLVRFLLIVGLAYFILYPLFVKLSLTFMDKKDLHDITVTLIPKTFTLDNIATVFRGMNYPVAFLNTAQLAVLVTVMQVVSCTLIGYGFAKFRFPGSGVLFMLVIFSLLVPPQVIITPVFIHYRYFDPLGLATLLTGGSVNLIDTYWPFVLNSLTGMGLKNGLFIYMSRQFFRSMPREIDDAAYVDGAGVFKTFALINLPNAVPMMTTIALFSFVWQWNDIFYIAWFFDGKLVLSTALESLAANLFYWENQGTNIGYNLDPAYVLLLNSIGTLFVILPLIVLYLFAQKVFVESIERSGIVG